MNRFAVNPLRRTGLTLVEAVLACVIVATMIVAALGAVGGAARGRLAQKNQSRAQALAGQLLSEIMQFSYRDPGDNPGFGPEPGETRATFNDVDDYHALAESPPTGRAGESLPGFTGWKRSTRVEYVDPTLLSVILGADSGLKRITVTVSSPTGAVTSLSAFRSANGVFDKNVTSQTAYTSWAGVTLQLGTDSNTRVVSGAVPLNQLP
jgi:MSHA pilin protein MshD